MYCFTNVFQFHKPNTCGNSYIVINSHLPTPPPPPTPIKLSQITVWGTSDMFSVVSFVSLFRLYIFVASFPIPILGVCRHYTQYINVKEVMSFRAIGFSYRQKSHWPLLHFVTGGLRFLLRVAGNMSLTQVVNKYTNKLYKYSVYCVNRDIFTKRKLSLCFYATY